MHIMCHKVTLSDIVEALYHVIDFISRAGNRLKYDFLINCIQIIWASHILINEFEVKKFFFIYVNGHGS